MSVMCVYINVYMHERKENCEVKQILFPFSLSLSLWKLNMILFFMILLRASGKTWISPLFWNCENFISLQMHKYKYMWEER